MCKISSLKFFQSYSKKFFLRTKLEFVKFFGTQKFQKSMRIGAQQRKTQSVSVETRVAEKIITAAP